MKRRLGRIVVKVGSSLVTNEGKGLDLAAIAHWSEQIARIRELCDAGGGDEEARAANRGERSEIVLVSSGAVAEGMKRLGWKRRPREMHDLQAAAAIGQMGLVQAYESSFRRHGIMTAQILLTHDDLADRKRYLNARSTLLRAC